MRGRTVRTHSTNDWTATDESIRRPRLQTRPVAPTTRRHGPRRHGRRGGRPPAGRADRGGPRGAAVRRRATPVAAGDRDASPASTGRPSMPGSATSRSASPGAASASSLRATGSSSSTAPEAGALDRPLRRRGRRPAVAGVARDAGDRRLPPAGHEVGDRADPRRRLGLHAADPAPPAAGRRARPGRRARAVRSCTGPASTSSSASA